MNRYRRKDGAVGSKIHNVIRAYTKSYISTTEIDDLLTRSLIHRQKRRSRLLEYKENRILARLTQAHIAIRESERDEITEFALAMSEKKGRDS
jgi:hypothetical protein